MLIWMQRKTEDHATKLGDLRRRRDRAAQLGADDDFVRSRTRDGLLERIEPMALDPKRILDIGGGSGRLSRALARRWRRSRIVSLDLSADMLAVGRRSRSRFSRIREVQGSAVRLPFAGGSFDLVISNLGLVSPERLSTAFAEVARVLRREGLFAFASLGPDSLVEIRRAWRAVDDGPHVQAFADMHDIGDALVRSGMRDPVLDVERLGATYASPRALYEDLTLAAARNAVANRRRSLTGRRRFGRFEQELEAGAADGRFSVTLELVFAHAWGSGPQQPPGEFAIDPASIGRTTRRR